MMKKILFLALFIGSLLKASSLDTTFSSDGYDTGNYTGTTILGGKVIVDDNGSIATVGRIDGDIQVVLYSSDGLIRTELAITPGTTPDNANAILMDSDGFPIVGAKLSAGGPTFITKVNNSGIDTNFNAPDGYELGYPVQGEQRIKQLYRLSSGKILEVGRNWNSAGGNINQITLTRYDANGTIDSTFNSSTHTVSLDINNSTSYYPSGFYEDISNSHMYFVASGGTKLVIFRTDLSGNLDGSYYGTGIHEFETSSTVTVNDRIITSFFDGTYFYIPTGSKVYKVDLAGNFSILFTATTESVYATDGDSYGNLYLSILDSSYKVMRIKTSDGSIDTTFGTSGYESIPGSTSTEYAIDVSDSGEYIAVMGDNFNVARFVGVDEQNKAPEISNDYFVIGDGTSASTYIGNFNAFDGDGDAIISYTISGVDAGDFDVNNTGDLTLMAAVDYATQNNYYFDLNITDSNGSIGTYSIHVEVVQSDITSDLVAHYELDNNLSDSTINNLDANETVDSVSYVTGAIGGAVDLNGSNALGVLDNNIFDFNDSYSISLWANPNSLQNATLIEKRDSGNYEWSIELVSDGSIEVTNGAYFDSNSSIVAYNSSSWNHIVYVYEYEHDEALIYINGQYAGAYSNDGGVGGDQNTTAPIYIASSYNQTGFFSGSLDDIRIYDRALNDVDIYSLYELNSSSSGSSAEIYLNLANLNLADHNITNIYYQGFDSNGSSLEFFSIADAQYPNLISGDNNVTAYVQNLGSYFLLEFETNTSESQSNHYIYNFDDGKLYLFDGSYDGNMSFLGSAYDGKTITFDTSNNSNWIETIPSSSNYQCSDSREFKQEMDINSTYFDSLSGINPSEFVGLSFWLEYENCHAHISDYMYTDYNATTGLFVLQDYVNNGSLEDTEVLTYDSSTQELSNSKYRIKFIEKATGADVNSTIFTGSSSSYHLAVLNVVDNYEVREVVEDYNGSGTTYSTFDELIAATCGPTYFEHKSSDIDSSIGLAFDSCVGGQSSGNVMEINVSYVDGNYTIINATAGTWSIVDADGDTTPETIKVVPSDTDAYDDTPIFRVEDGVVKRGEFEAAGTGFEFYQFDAVGLSEFNSYFSLAPGNYSEEQECEENGFVWNGSACETPSYSYSPYIFSYESQDFNVTVEFTSTPSTTATVSLYLVPIYNLSDESLVFATGAISSDTNITVTFPGETISYFLKYHVYSPENEYIESGFYSSTGTVFSLDEATAISIDDNLTLISLNIDSGNLIQGQLLGATASYQFIAPSRKGGKDTLDGVAADVNSSGDYQLRVPDGNYTFKYFGSGNDGIIERGYYHSSGTVANASDAEIVEVTGANTINITALTQSSVTLSLVAGWNLVSIPAKARYDLHDMHMIFNNGYISHLVKYNSFVGWTYFWLDSSSAVPAYARFAELNSKEGFWAKADSATTIAFPLSGNESSASNEIMTLHTGWNLIGFPVDKTVSEINSIAISQGKTIDAIWVYRSGAWYVHYPNTTEITSTLLSTDTISASEGIWLKAK